MLVEHSCKHSAVHLSWQVFGGLLQVRVKLYSIFHLQQLAQPPDLASQSSNTAHPQPHSMYKKTSHGLSGGASVNSFKLVTSQITLFILNLNNS